MTKIIAPFKYEDLSRKNVDGKRLYSNPWGDPVPSVTTILDKTKPAEKRAALAEWKKRVGEEKAQQIVTEAAGNGTMMHDQLEAWNKGVEYTGKSTALSRMMAKVIIDNIESDLDEVWGAEVKLCAPNLYAGTTDLVGVYKGKPTIMDYKQSNKRKKREWIDDYFLQGAAYAVAHNELYGTNIRNIAIFMCTKQCEWQLFEVGEDEFGYWEQKWAERLAEFYSVQV